MFSPALRNELRPGVEIGDRFILGAQIPHNTESDTLIFNAHDSKADSDAVIKAFHLNDYQDNRLFGPMRFNRELHAGIGLRHPSIVSVIDCGSLGDDDRYLATPKANQGSLANANMDTLRVEVAAQVWSILLDIGDGLHYAHQKGYLHLDVNPSNMLVNNNRGWLADFGIVSSVKGSRLSRSYPFLNDLLQSKGLVVGTLRYASPEQLQFDEEKKLRPASDMFSWGVSALHMMNGGHPYSESGYVPTNINVATAYNYAKSVKVPRRDDLPKEMYELLAHCVKARPSKRPSDFSEITGIGRTILNLETVSNTK